MRALLLTLSAAWLTLPFLINDIITAQGKLIGGRNLFDHMGMGGALAAQTILIFSSAIIALVLIVTSIKKRGSHSFALYLSLAILFLIIITYFHPRISLQLPIIFHRLVGAIFVGHYVFPPEFIWVKYFALLLSAATTLLLKISNNSDHSDEINSPTKTADSPALWKVFWLIYVIPVSALHLATSYLPYSKIYINLMIQASNITTLPPYKLVWLTTIVPLYLYSAFCWYSVWKYHLNTESRAWSNLAKIFTLIHFLWYASMLIKTWV